MLYFISSIALCVLSISLRSVTLNGKTRSVDKETLDGETRFGAYSHLGAVIAPSILLMALMQRVLRRSLSQQAVVAAGRHSSGSSQNAVRSLEFQGRSFLLPTLTLVRGAGAAAMKTARAHKTPIVLDMQLVSSDGSPHARPIKKHELRAELEHLQVRACVLSDWTNVLNQPMR